METPALDPAADAFWNSRDPILLADPRHPLDAADRLTGIVADSLVLFRTSGSQGHPTVVGLTREALLTSARAVNEFLHVTSADVWLRVLPWFHVGGFGVVARARAAGCALLSDDEKWDGRRFCQQCGDGKVTLSSLVPAQVYDLVQAGLAAPNCLRAAIVGGGELRPGLWTAARALGWPVLASYGLTEAGSQVATQHPGSDDPTTLTLLPHWNRRLAADGTLELRGPAMATCRIARDGTGKWQRHDLGGWLSTADRVELGTDTLRFIGRRDRVVKRLGELIDLAALDRPLADAALAGGGFGRVRLQAEPDERAGCRLVLECLDGAVGARVAALFNAGQPAFARIGETRVVDDLRLSPLGKPML